MTEPVLMYCVGAAKAGTSWLHRQLSDHPDCHFRAVKELHYFSSFDWDELGGNIARVEAIRARLTAEAEGDLTALQLANKVRQLAHVEHYLEVLRLGYEDRDAYLAYLNLGRGDARVVGEMTPAYSLLDERRLGAMARITDDVRFIYLLRDPVERLWSHVRMIAGRRAAHPGEVAERAGNILRRVVQGKEDQIARRSDYAGALARLSAAIDPTRLLVAIYEEMFSGDALARICVFLGISPRPPELARVVHAGQPLTMSEPQRAMAAHWLVPQFDATAGYLGAMPGAWTANLTRVS